MLGHVGQFRMYSLTPPSPLPHPSWPFSQLSCEILQALQKAPNLLQFVARGAKVGSVSIIPLADVLDVFARDSWTSSPSNARSYAA